MKTWHEKFNNGKSPQIKTIEKPFSGYPAGTPMYISTPREIDDFIRKLSPGQNISVSEMRDTLAKQNGAEFTCALTTGIFLRIVSERAYQQYTENRELDERGSITSITPFWRIVDPNSKLADKLSFGKKFISDMRSTENVK